MIHDKSFHVGKFSVEKIKKMDWDATEVKNSHFTVIKTVINKTAFRAKSFGMKSRYIRRLQNICLYRNQKNSE